MTTLKRNREIERPSSSTSSTSNQPEWIRRLFKKLSLRYGDQFSKKLEGGNPDDVMNEWRQVLDGLEMTQIALGLHNWSSQYPPNPYEFKQACLGDNEPMAPYHAPLPALTNKSKPTPTVAEYWRSKMAAGDHSLTEADFESVARLQEEAGNPVNTGKTEYTAWANRLRATGRSSS